MVPSWQEIIDDIIEVLTLKHPALKDNSAISSVSINSVLLKADPLKIASSMTYAETKDDMSDDMLDTLVIHKFKCGHIIKVPKYMYLTISRDEMAVCQECM